MSKLKVSHVAPRFERGTTYIGEDGSVTHFHPHSQVILHDYATEDWVLDQITGDIDLGDYLTKEEAEDTYSQRLGRKFKYTTGGKSSTSYAPGDLFFTTENNVAYTEVLGDARYVCFAWEDVNGMIWKTAKLGQLALPPGHIVVEYQDKMMGWFDYEGGTAAITDGSQTGSVVIPVTGWNSTTAVSVLTPDLSYELITQFWN